MASFDQVNDILKTNVRDHSLNIVIIGHENTGKSVWFCNAAHWCFERALLDRQPKNQKEQFGIATEAVTLTNGYKATDKPQVYEDRVKLNEIDGKLIVLVDMPGDKFTKDAGESRKAELNNWLKVLSKCHIIIVAYNLNNVEGHAKEKSCIFHVLQLLRELAIEAHGNKPPLPTLWFLMTHADSDASLMWSNNTSIGELLQAHDIVAQSIASSALNQISYDWHEDLQRIWNESGTKWDEQQITNNETIRLLWPIFVSRAKSVIENNLRETQLRISRRAVELFSNLQVGNGLGMLSLLRSWEGGVGISVSGQVKEGTYRQTSGHDLPLQFGLKRYHANWETIMSETESKILPTLWERFLILVNGV